MLSQLLKFEFYYQIRQRVFIVALVMFALMGIGYGAKVAVNPTSFVNSAYNLTYAVANLSLLATFFVALLCGNAALRDTDAKMTELVGAAPVSPLKLHTSRFLSYISLSTTIFVLGILCIAVGFLFRDGPASEMGPFVLSYYLWPLLTFALPNILLVSAVVYFTATVTRSQSLTFLSGVLVLVLYLVGSLVFDSPTMGRSAQVSEAKMTLIALLDPYAIANLFHQAADWTGAEKNTRLMAFSGTFMLNRLLWLGFSGLLLFLSYHFSVTRRFASGKRKVKKNAPEVKEKEQGIKQPYRPVDSSQGVSLWLCFWHDFKLQSQAIIKSSPFLSLLLLTAVLVASQIINQISNGPIGPLFPHTGILLGFIFRGLAIFGPLVVIYYAAELVWRDRDSRLAPLIDATPATNLSLFLAKSATLALMIVLLGTVSNLVGMIYQLSRGFEQFDGMLYLYTYYLFGLPLFQLGMLCLFIQNLSNNKYLGLLISAAVVAIFTTDAAAILGLEHNLMLFAGTGPKIHSQLNGFGHLMTAVNWFSLYWSIATVILMMLSYGLWQRGTAQSIGERIKRLPMVWGKGGQQALVGAVILLISTGSYIFYNTNVVNAFVTETDRLDWQQDYEQQIRPFSSLPMPQITDIHLAVDIFPHQRSSHIKGHYWLENQTDKPIEQLLLTIPDARVKVTFKIAGVTLAKANERLGTHLFDLNDPMAVGGRIKVDYTLNHANQGFKNTADDVSVVDNGSFLHNSDTLPYLGYNSGNEISNSTERQKRELGLGSQIPKLPVYNNESTRSVHGESLINYEVVASTIAGQTVITPGKLLKQWHEGGRAYFHYRTSQPIRNTFGLVSGKYERYQDQYNEVEINIYHDPRHHYNLKRIANAAKVSLAYFEKNFSPYGHQQLQFVEIPYRGFARAYPGMVAFSEKAGFIGDYSNPDTLDMVSQITAHEVAHQWFGHQLDAALVEGQNLVIESVAEYASLMVMKKMYGESFIKQFKRTAMADYLNGRSGDTLGEVPLHKLINQRYLRYKKGAVVFLSLTELMGEANINQALANLMAEKVGDRQNPATSLDLIRHIKQMAQPAHYAQIDDWFKSVVIFNNKIERAVVNKLPDGRFKITLNVTTEKRRYSSPSTFEVEPAGRPITIAVYEALPRYATAQEVLHSQPYEFDKNQSTVEIIVDSEPAFVVIDPQIMTIDRNLGDNQVELMAAE
ncbi:MAG: hypothetical protein HRT35_11270 [Algicola sp.]|nr:hypothetical protein [Algicola sp.]